MATAAVAIRDSRATHCSGCGKPHGLVSRPLYALATRQSIAVLDVCGECMDALARQIDEIIKRDGV